MSASLNLAVELAHDMRSPLSAFTMLTELLGSGATGPMNDSQRRLLGVMHDAAVGLSRMTTDFVEAGRARITEGREATSAFEVRDVLSAVQSIVQPMAERSGLTVVMSDCGTRRWRGSRTAITRVLLNLTTNALKYTEHGTVEYGARQLGASRLRFFVRDTGGGLSGPGGRPICGAEWKTSSTGLGLAISRQLLSEMGSALELESTPGVGCCFHFDLSSNDSADASARRA